MTHIFDTPIAGNGTTIEVPVQASPDGWVSLEEGFTEDYELPYPAVPGAKPVERWEINSLFKLVSEALGELQQHGYSVWQAREWPEGSRVVHAGTMYQSSAATAAEPPSAPWVAEDGALLVGTEGTNNVPYKWSAEQLRAITEAWFELVSGAKGRDVLLSATAEDARSTLGLGTSAVLDVGTDQPNVLPADLNTLALGEHRETPGDAALQLATALGVINAELVRKEGTDADLTLRNTGAGDLQLIGNLVAQADKYPVHHSGNLLQSLGDSTVYPVSQKTITEALSGIDIGTGPYGLRWNQETNIYTELGATVRTQIQSKMRRCVLNPDGTVNYYLDPFDSTKKADGTPAVLTGADGNVMVEIPKFYYRHTLNGNVHEWWIGESAVDGMQVHPYFLKDGVTEVDFAYYRAYEGFMQAGVLKSISGVTPTRSITRAAFRAAARLNGSGWNIAHLHGINAIRMLYLLEYNSFNSQSKLGTGNDAGSDFGMLTGQSNVIGNDSSGPLNNNTWMSYRGIENFYADIWEFIDGFNVNNRVPYVSNVEADFADGVYSGSYIEGTVMPSAGNSWIQKITGDFLPTQVGGSSATYITDACWTAATPSLGLHGGHAGDGLSGGAFALVASYAFSHAGAAVGAGLSFR